jgi:glycosidase
VLLCLASVLAVPGVPSALADHTAAPSSVTLAGSLQSELGCPGDWQPECATSHLEGKGNGVWRAQFAVPAGSYAYKLALNDGWTEAYPGGDKALAVTAADPTRFYYDHKTHAALDSVNDKIATAAGSFQSEIGCPADWSPDCVQSLLTDADGDGTYTFESDTIPAGSYAFKVARDEQWTTSYPANDVPFTVAAAGRKVTFSWNSSTNDVSVDVATGGVVIGDNNIAFDGLFHDSRDPAYRYPGGAAAINTPITLRFQTSANDVGGVRLRTFRDTSGRPGGGETVYDMQRVAKDAPCISGPAGQSCDYWEAQVDSGAKSTLYYRFIVTDGTRTVFYEDNTDNNNTGSANIGDGGAGVARDASPDASWAINVYVPAGFTVIPWVRDGVWYQIFPDRFRNDTRSNDPKPTDFRYNYPTPEDGNPATAALDQIQNRRWDQLPEGYCRAYRNANGSSFSCGEQPRGRDYFGGDLRGIRSRLDYLDSLGVTILYLNPIFAAGSNHRYDTRDYYQIDPALGTLQDFKDLVNAAHNRGMRVVLDGVFNHLSSDSAFFDRYHHYSTSGACEDPNAQFRSWFYFRTPSQGQPAPCAPSTPGGSDTYYDGWFGFDSIPVINKNRQDVRDYFYGSPQSVALYWLAQGADGWRLDVASDGSFPEYYWREFRQQVKAQYPNAVIIGEMWKKFEHLPFLQGDKVDSVQGYRLRDAVLGFIGRGASDNKGFAGEGQAQTASQFAAKLLSIREDNADASLHNLMNGLGSHDTARLLWLLTPGANNREEREFNAANLAIGKERQRLAALVAFTQPGPPVIYYGDEVGLTGYDDPDDRRPFPWKVKSDGTPSEGLNASADRDLLNFYKDLAKARKRYTTLRTGEQRFLLTDDANSVVAYSRKADKEVSLVVLNVGDTSRTIEVPVADVLRNGATLKDALGSLGRLTVSGGKLTLTLGARQGALLVTNTGQDLTPPAAPSVSLNGHGDGAISLKWAAVKGAASYRVYRSRLSHGGYELVTPAPIAGTTFNDSGLVNGVPYYYLVTALDSAGNESARSNEVSDVAAFAFGYGAVYSSGTSVTVGSGDAGKITLYFQVYAENHTPGPGPDPAIIAQFGYGPAGSSPLTWTWQNGTYQGEVGNNDEFVGDVRPRAAGSYNFLARFSSDGGSTWFYADRGETGGSTSGQLGGDGNNDPGVLSANASPDTTAPAAPTGLTAANGGPSTIELSWAANSEPDLYAYSLFRSATPGGPYTQIGGDIPAGTTSYADATVTSGVAYYYIVKALDSSFNASAASAEASATPAPRTVSITFNVAVAADSGITEADKLFITGNPGNILCGFCDPQTIQLTKNSLTSWTVTLSNVPENTKLEYKYTLGTFTYVEKDANCGEINNRQVTATYGPGGTITVSDTVPRFRNLAGCPS